MLFSTAGFFGVALYIGFYPALQSGLIVGSGYLHAGANLAAASLVLVSLLTALNRWAAIFPITWIGIGLFGLGRAAEMDDGSLPGLAVRREARRLSADIRGKLLAANRTLNLAAV